MAPSTLDTASGFLDRASGKGFGALIVTGIGAVWLSIVSGVISIQQGIAGVFADPLGALGDGAAALTAAFTTDPANFLGGAWELGLQAFSRPPWNALGPFIPWLAAGIGLGTVAMLTWYLDQNDSDVPGTGTDLPVIGNDSDGEED